MKNLIISTLLILVCAKSYSQSAPMVIELQSLNLPDSVMAVGSAPDYSKEVLERIRLKPAPGTEGTEQTELRNPAPQVYSTATVITKALEDSQMLPMGEKIEHFEKAVKKVLATSGTRRHEIVARMTLNRAVDTMNTVLPIAGNNPEEVARFAANFYTEAFKLALSFTANQFHLQSIITFDEFYKNNLYIIDYGRMMATLMYRFSMNANLSDSAKSVMLIKSLGYLGWDMQLDLRSREQSVRELLADIYSIQKEDRNLKNILVSIDSGYEPKTADVNKLRGRVFRILEQLPLVISKLYTH